MIYFNSLIRLYKHTKYQVLNYSAHNWTVPAALAILRVLSGHLGDPLGLSVSSDVALWPQTDPQSESTEEECPCGHTVESSHSIVLDPCYKAAQSTNT